MLNTLVYNPLVYKGFQWLLYNRTIAGADWPAMFLPSVASVGVFLPLNVRLS